MPQDSLSWHAHTLPGYIPLLGLVVNTALQINIQ